MQQAYCNLVRFGRKQPHQSLLVCTFFMVIDMDNGKYITEIMKLAKKAYKKDEVPVGAIVVLNNKIIGKGYNLKEKKKCVISHAEIIAIEEACKYNHDWRLDDAELYVTLEPLGANT